MVTRRSVLTQIGVLGGTVVGAGCLSSGGNKTAENEIAVGPNNNYVFKPESVEIAVGETLTWAFESKGHNVSAKPNDHSKIKIPDDATPFASYDGHKSFELIPNGETYKHTFETPGTYTYVCIPHANVGMVGDVTVSE